MQPTTNLPQVYKDLADGYERRGQAQMRDRFLVLAADAALAAGQADEAERLRQRLLMLNPHHMLKPYANFSQARQAPDVDTYVRNLRLNYPQDVAEDLRRTLQIGHESTPQTLAPPSMPPAPPSVEQSMISHMGPGIEGSIAWHLPPEDEPVVEKTASLPAGVNPIRALMQAAQEQAAHPVAKPRQQPPGPRPIVPDPSKLEQTAPLPAAGPARMPARPIAGDAASVEQTAALPISGLGRPLPPTRVDSDKTDATPRGGSRPAPAPTPRSAAPPPRPVPAAPSPRPAPPTRPPAPFTFDSSGKVPVVPRSGGQAAQHSGAPQEEGSEGYDWLASALFVLVAVLGLAAVGYTLARPFLQ
jgi:hypothetical protein